jgi:hypothetical protein
MFGIYILLIIFIYLYYYFYYIIKKNNTLLNIVDYDIIYYTGGYYGFYQLGVSHYIKNNFNYKNKSTLGISAGSWLAVFMKLDNTNSKLFLSSLFKTIKRNTPIQLLPSIIKNCIQPYVNNISIENINIVVTNISEFKYTIHNTFLSVNDVINCCTASSFVPFVTYKDLFYFYNHKLVVDGGLFKRIYLNKIDTDKTLIIKYDMFGRFKNFKLFKSFRKPSYTFYELYMLGYKDACRNHKYLQQYFD